MVELTKENRLTPGGVVLTNIYYTTGAILHALFLSYSTEKEKRDKPVYLQEKMENWQLPD
ncbi:hypothetical protein AS260_15135 [Enterococcus faecium]|nr:hypothetical protein AS260_15135 [Enterococcus faecium]